MGHLTGLIIIGISCTLLVSLDLLSFVLLEEVVKLDLCSIKPSAYLTLYILDRKLPGRGMMTGLVAPIIILWSIFSLDTSKAVNVLIILLSIFDWSAHRTW